MSISCSVDDIDRLLKLKKNPPDRSLPLAGARFFYFDDLSVWMFSNFKTSITNTWNYLLEQQKLKSRKARVSPPQKMHLVGLWQDYRAQVQHQVQEFVFEAFLLIV